MKQKRGHKKLTIQRIFAAISVLSLLVSVIPMEETWAWFKTNRTNPISTMRFATFDADVTVSRYDSPAMVSLAADGSVASPVVKPNSEDGLYYLTPGLYTVTLSRTPESTASSGYCTVRTATGLTAYTEPLTGELEFTLEVKVVDEENPNTPDQIEIIPCWGSYQGSGAALYTLTPALCIEDGMILNSWGEALPEMPDEYIGTDYEALFEYDLPRYYQNDYPNNRYGSGSIATDGCGVVTLASIASYITGYTYTPDVLARWFGGRAENNIKRFEIGATTLNLPWKFAQNIDEAYAALQEGMILALMMDGYEETNPFTTTQHFLVVRGITSDGRFLITDPNRINYTNWELRDGFRKGFTKDSLIAGYSGAWIFDPYGLDEEFEPYIKEEYPRQDNYPGVELTYAEQELMAKLIWAEARGECAEGQQAVAEVVLNRLVSGRFGKTISNVILGEGQFRGADKIDDAEPWQAQYDAIEAARYGKPILDKDVFYFATYALNSEIFATIGGHIFCRDEIISDETKPEETKPEETQPEETKPEETKPEETKPEETKPEETEPEETEPEETQPEETQPEAIIHEIPSLYQSDYSDIPYGNSTLGESGAGILTLSMAASYMTGFDYTPDMLADWFGHSAADDMGILETAASTLDLPWTSTGSLSKAVEAASEGKLLILRLESDGSDNAFTSGVHYILIRGVTEDGRYMVNDPSKDNQDRSDLQDSFANGFALEAFSAAVTHTWILDPEAIPDDYQPYIP